MSGTRRALIVLNSGIGNNVIAAPVLEAVDAVGVFDEYHVLCHQPFLPETLLRHVRVPGLRVAQLPGLTRRFRPEDWDGIFAYLRESGIGVVLNARLEIASLDTNYLSFREVAASRSIECWDLHEDGMWEAGSIGQRIVALLRRHGVALPDPRCDWLTPLRRAPGTSIGCFVGASRGVKRWPAQAWMDTVTRIRQRGWPVEVAAGPDRVERKLAGTIVEALGDPMVSLLPAVDLEGFVNWLAGLRGLVAGDTAATHLAAAAVTPVVSLHLATDSAVWRPLGDLTRPMQSPLALRCRAMKRDGTCTRLYRGCPAPCRKGITPDEVVQALDELCPVPLELRHRKE